MREIEKARKATDEEVRRLKKFFSDKNTRRAEASLKAIQENKDLLIEYYHRYDNNDPVFKSYHGITHSHWNWVPDIIKAAGINTQIRAKDLYEFYMAYGLDCLYKKKSSGQTKPYSTKFETYKEVNRNEKRYLNELYRKFIDYGYEPQREFPIAYNFVGDTTTKYKFIDLLAIRKMNTEVTILIVEGKVTVSDIKNSQLDFYKALVEKMIESHKKYNYFIRCMFYVDREISYIPDGEYKYPVYSIGKCHFEFKVEDYL